MLAATLPGMPLVYSGQEAVLDRRLAFFDKDEIQWKSYARTDFYAGLLALKHRHRALANGAAGGALEILETGDRDHVFAFRRARGKDRVVVIANLSAEPREVTVKGVGRRTLPAWGHLIEG